jgi:hypothetical protein
MPYLLSVLLRIKNKEALAGLDSRNRGHVERHRCCASTANVAAVRRTKIGLAPMKKRPLLFRGESGAIA